MNKDLIFALDIGTRTVVGLLCRVTDKGNIKVEYYDIEAHPQRSMMDGQIHDVVQVSRVISKVKGELERQSGLELKQAAIAAAGRALSTLKSSSELKFPATREVTDEDVRHLEMKALGEAREKMTREKSNFYCVGYSPISYTLNQLAIANPVGQRGQVIGVEIIATFLPQVVVDSLFSALSKSELLVQSLTLEPIAAMSLAIPERLRMLNLALIDIGAGTSDIAISRSGTVMAYDMADSAGDEVTEAIAQHYLLDFNGAERVKLALHQGGEVEFTDVLGNHYRESAETILELVEPVVEELARTLAEKIKENNGGKPPAAVFCVGGGSQTPLLPAKLALSLGLPEERVGIRTRANLEEVEFESLDLSGPEVVTPLGIAMTALKPRGEHFMQVKVNGDEVTLFNVQRSVVAQALLHSSIKVEDVLGVRGPALEYVLNGQSVRIAGEPGSPGSISVDGQEATLETPIAPGARIEVDQGKQGDQAACTLEALSESVEQLEVTVNGTRMSLPPIRKINGLPAQPDTVISPGDKVEIRPPTTVQEAAMLMDIDMDKHSVKVNGSLAEADTAIAAGDKISFDPREERSQQATDSPPADDREVAVTVNGQRIVLQPGQQQLMHALALADIDYSSARGQLVIHLNGRDAEFSSPLNQGDKVEVFWTSQR